MKFNALLRQFEAALKSHYAGRLLPSMYQAINALLRCRTEAAGAIKLHCPDKGEDFCWLVLQHVLPKGFRRIRDYGFLHGNAKKVLKLVQLMLRVVVEIITPRPRPVLNCPHCQAPLAIIGFIQPHWESG